jgi:hypothetical protein
MQQRLYDKRQRQAMRNLAERQSQLIDTVHEAKTTGQAFIGVHSVKTTFQLAISNGTYDPDDSQNKSLGLFRLDSPARLQAITFQTGPFFSRTILLVIVLSCLSLAVEGPPGQTMGFIATHLTGFFSVINVLVLFLFSLEVSLKCIGHGFYWKCGPTAPFMATRMNQLDLLLILVCTISYIPGIPLNGNVARILRLGRVITPMLNLMDDPDIKMVFVAFVRAVPDTAMVLIPLSIMTLIFAILGVAIFSTALKGCAAASDPLLLLDAEEFPFNNETFCKESPDWVWVSPPFNFENTPRAMATLFATLVDGAHEIMMATTTETTFWTCRAYWVAFLMLFTAFFLNLFLGVLSASFEKSSGAALMTLQQKRWHSASLRIKAFQPVRSVYETLRPHLRTKCCSRKTTPLWWYWIRYYSYEAAVDPRLDRIWQLSILANTATLALEYYPAASVEVQSTISSLNILFVLMQACEVVIKLVGFGYHFYFRDGWLVSDMVVVGVAIYMRATGVTSGVEVLRVIRIFRMILLAAKVPSLVALIDTLVRCIRASVAMLIITMLLIYLFSVVGMWSFGLLPYREVLELKGITVEQEREYRAAGVIIAKVCDHCSLFTDYSNFSDFVHAAKLLMQVALGQDIGDMISDMQYLGASFWPTFLFCALFYMIVVWVCINLVVVTVLSNFDKATADKNINSVTYDIVPIDLQGFAYTWAALTIGSRSSDVCHSEAQLLEHLSKTLAAECETKGVEFENPTTVNFQDGDPAMVGTLKIRIERVNNLSCLHENHKTQGHVPALYCKASKCGDKFTTKVTHATQTVSAYTDDNGLPPDSAVWWEGDGTEDTNMMSPSPRDSIRTPTPGNKSPSGRRSPRKNKRAKAFGEGGVFKFHIGYDASHIDFEVRDAYQFCDNLLGGACIPLEQIRGAIEEGSFEGTSETVTVQLRSNPHVPERLHSRAGGPSKWEKYARLSGAGGGVKRLGVFGEADSVNAVEEQNQAQEQATKESEAVAASMKEAKQTKRASKAAAKSQAKKEKLRKKAQKAADRKKRRKEKRARKRRKQMGNEWSEPEEPEDLTEDEPEEDDTTGEHVHRFYRPGWDVNGVELELSYAFEPHGRVATQSYLYDYRTFYAHKDSNCGVEGWLEFSDGTHQPARRFCYLQANPRPCMKVILGAESISELERAALRNGLTTIEIPAANILSITQTSDASFAVETRVMHGEQGMRAVIAGGIINMEGHVHQFVGKRSTVSACCTIEVTSSGDVQKSVTTRVAALEQGTGGMWWEWGHNFHLPIVPTTTQLVVRVFNGSPKLKTSKMVGVAELDIIQTVPQDGSAAKGDDNRVQVSVRGQSLQLSGSGTDASVMHPSVQLSRTEPTTIVVKLSGSDGYDASLVTLEMEHIDVQLDDADDDAAQLADELEAGTYVLKATRPDIARQWLAGLRWICSGCSSSFDNGPLPPERICEVEMSKVENNVAMLSLPFDRVTLLLRSLYQMRVMGSHKPTLRRLGYTIFNLETFAWSDREARQISKAEKHSKQHRSAGLYLHELRGGLDFYSTLHRLALLHYGKKRCLSYEDQMIEHETERRHVALHVISTCLSLAVFRRIKRVQGAPWPWHDAWRRYPATYAIAIEGLAASRLRTLRTLRREIMRRRPRQAESPAESPGRKRNASLIESNDDSSCCRRKKQETGDDHVAASASTDPASPSNTEVQKLKELFEWIDTDGSGELGACCCCLLCLSPRSCQRHAS